MFAIVGIKIAKFTQQFHATIWPVAAIRPRAFFLYQLAVHARQWWRVSTFLGKFWRDGARSVRWCSSRTLSVCGILVVYVNANWKNCRIDFWRHKLSRARVGGSMERGGVFVSTGKIDTRRLSYKTRYFLYISLSVIDVTDHAARYCFSIWFDGVSNFFFF